MMVPIVIQCYHMTKTLYTRLLPVKSSTDMIISIKCFEESDSLASTCKRLMKAVDDRVVKPESVLKETGKLPASSTETVGYQKLI